MSQYRTVRAWVWRFEEKNGVDGLVLSGSGHAGEGQASQEASDLLFRGEAFELGVLEEGAIAAEPVDAGSFGVDRKVAEHTSLSH